MLLSSVQESRLLAQTYLKAQPAEVQVRAREFFRSLDKDGDGFLRQEDLLGSGAVAEAVGLTSEGSGGGPAGRLRELFHTLDADRNGVLDFHECMTLYYLLAVRPRSCASCRACILSLGYTCTACWQSRPSIDATFDLCRPCFSFRSFSHHHDSFLDEHEMYNLMLFTSFYTNQRVQCKTCGDFHNKYSPSYLVKEEGGHMTQDTKDQDSFICEWCLTWQCSKCGVFFKGQMCSARPGQWLEKSRFCHRCGGQKKTKIDLETLLEDLKAKNLDRSCDTCRVKIQKGTLAFSNFVNSSSSKKKSTSENMSTIGMLDVMNNGFKSVEIGGKLCNTLMQKDMCPLM